MYQDILMIASSSLVVVGPSLLGPHGEPVSRKPFSEIKAFGRRCADATSSKVGRLGANLGSAEEISDLGLLLDA
jgi:hypothetical protein